MSLCCCTGNLVGVAALQIVGAWVTCKLELSIISCLCRLKSIHLNPFSKKNVIMKLNFFNSRENFRRSIINRNLVNNEDAIWKNFWGGWLKGSFDRLSLQTRFQCGSLAVTNLIIIYNVMDRWPLRFIRSTCEFVLTWSVFRSWVLLNVVWMDSFLHFTLFTAHVLFGSLVDCRWNSFVMKFQARLDYSVQVAGPLYILLAFSLIR